MKRDVESPFTDSAFLTLISMMNHLGLEISCVPVRAGEMEFGLELVIGRLDLVFTSVELMSHGVEPFLPAQLTLLGV